MTDQKDFSIDLLKCELNTEENGISVFAGMVSPKAEKYSYVVTCNGEKIVTTS